MKANWHVVDLPILIDELDCDSNIVVSSFGLPKICTKDREEGGFCHGFDLSESKGMKKTKKQEKPCP
jgi:hypothetical protein